MNKQIENMIAAIKDPDNHHIRDEGERRAWVNFATNQGEKIALSARTELIKEIRDKIKKKKEEGFDSDLFSSLEKHDKFYDEFESILTKLK